MLSNLDIKAIDIDAEWDESPKDVYFDTKGVAAYAKMLGDLYGVRVSTDAGWFGTDGKTIYIPPLVCLSIHQVEAAAGAITHEMAHILFGRSAYMKEFLDTTDIPQDIAKTIYNLVADYSDESALCCIDTYGRVNVVLKQTACWLLDQSGLKEKVTADPESLTWEEHFFLARISSVLNCAHCLPSTSLTAKAQDVFVALLPHAINVSKGTPPNEMASDLARQIARATNFLYNLLPPPPPPPPALASQPKDGEGSNEQGQPQPSDSPGQDSENNQSPAPPDEQQGPQGSGQPSSAATDTPAPQPGLEEGLRKKLLESLSAQEVPNLDDNRRASTAECRALAYGHGLDGASKPEPFDDKLARDVLRDLRTVVTRMVESERADGIDPGHLSGPKMTNITAVFTDGRAFGRREAEGERASVALLLDSSGSMAGDMGQISALCWAFWKALSPWADIATWAFSCAPWPIPSVDLLKNSGAHDGTSTHLAIDVATAHLRAQKPTRKILIVLTDGDTEARQCNSSIDKAIDCGINVIGVALKDDAKLNRTMKNAHKIRATTPESVARELSLITRKILRKK